MRSVRKSQLVLILSIFVLELSPAFAEEQTVQQTQMSNGSDSALIAYTLRAWKTDEFDLSEVGEIVEQIPLLGSGQLTDAAAKEMFDRGSKLLAEKAGIKINTEETPPAGAGAPSDAMRKLGSLESAARMSGKIKLQIFTRKLDGSELKQLTFVGDNGRADWSPDGNKIAFSSYRDGKRSVGVMDADGQNQTMLTDGASPDWSPDGKQIAFARDNQIWVMNSDGTGQRQITTSTTSNKSGPSWSPDAKQMVFILRPVDVTPKDSRVEIGIMNSDGTSERMLTAEDRTNVHIEPDGSQTVLETAYDANAPAWSPVDDRIAMWSGIKARYGQVWTIRADGTDSKQLTDHPQHRNSDDPSWSPDGTKVIFSTGRNGRNELWIMDSDGNNERVLFPIDANPYPGRATWQPKH